MARTSHKDAVGEAALIHLQQLFPTADAAFLESCISHHLAAPSSSTGSGLTAATARIVERVSHKLLEGGGGGGGTGQDGEDDGWWPTYRFWRYVNVEQDEVEPRDETRAAGGSIAARAQVRHALEAAYGTRPQRLRRVTDLTTERNLVLIRLHRVFPTVPISDLRELILSSSSCATDAGPSILWTGVEILLERATRQQRLHDGGAWWNAVVGFFSSLAPCPPAAAVGDPTRGKGNEQGGARADSADPVLTAHDLFHSASYDAALAAHLRALFPSVQASRIDRLVRRQGGSYASLRQQLEAEVLEANGAGIEDAAGEGRQPRRGQRGRAGPGAAVAKWWKSLIRIQHQEDEAATTAPVVHPSGRPVGDCNGGGGAVSSSDTAAPPSGTAVRTWHPFLDREIEAYGRRAHRHRNTTEQRAESVDAMDTSAGLGGGNRNKEQAVTECAAGRSTGSDTNSEFLNSGDEFECQCCFSTEPASPVNRFSCDGQPAALVAAAAGTGVLHSFCQSCVRSLAETYAFGGSRLSIAALEQFALPCMAATTASEPCSGMIGRAELRRALDDRLWTALDRRMTETVLERFSAAQVVAAGTAQNSQQPRRGHAASVVRCPFCPYAELADPTPGPLVATFCPAWVREPFPPSVGDLVRSLVGGGLLLPFLALLLAILVLVTPTRRLERAYERIIAAQEPEDTHPAAGLTSRSRLTLSDRLVLEPWLLPAVVFAHLASVCERVRARRHGRRTVFRCRNFAAGGGGRRSRWEAVIRMDAVETLDWTGNGTFRPELAEEARGDPYVEEARRQRLVRFVWGDDVEADPSSSPSAESPGCGRVSCLLCHAALNPAAPSLHACRSSSPSPSASLDKSETASAQEQAEESLRLVVEKAMNAAVVRECASCGAGLTKKGGEGACNKITCRCGFAYCYVCLGPISWRDGYAHFCPHPRDPLDPAHCPNAGCTKCSLWIEPDLAKRRREAADRARERWARENPEWAETVAKSKPLGDVGADSHFVPLYEQTLDWYDSVVESIARLLQA
ncbi:hypothetical protein JCM3774_003599 [Rhodotorula dairenensis]